MDLKIEERATPSPGSCVTGSKDVDEFDRLIDAINHKRLNKRISSYSSVSSSTKSARLGRYQLVKRLGRGGMAEVFLAIHRGAAGFERPVCLKKILPELASDGEFRELFIREASLSGGLLHSNLVQVFDCFEEGEDLAIVMELVDGVDLKALYTELRRRGAAMPPKLVAHIAGQVLSGLHFAHSRKIIHRDISPHNILVSRHGEVKITDFGIAKALITHVTRTGKIRGKLAYMSPEQASAKSVDRRTDLYSTGLVLVELLTGTRYFKRSSRFDLVNRVMNAKQPKIGGVDPALARFVERLLAPRRNDRFRSTAEALECLPNWRELGPSGAKELGRLVEHLDFGAHTWSKTIAVEKNQIEEETQIQFVFAGHEEAEQQGARKSPQPCDLAELTVSQEALFDGLKSPRSTVPAKETPPPHRPEPQVSIPPTVDLATLKQSAFPKDNRGEYIPRSWKTMLLLVVTLSCLMLFVGLALGVGGRLIMELMYS